MMHDLTQGIVRILDADGSTSGTGFVANRQGLIAICAHVIESAGYKRGDCINVVFYPTNEQRKAVVSSSWWRDSAAEDVAILVLEDELPGAVQPLQLGQSRGSAGRLRWVKRGNDLFWVLPRI